MHQKVSAIAVAVLAAGFTAISCAAETGDDEDSAAVQLRLVHEEADADVQGQYAARFEERVEERTEGRVEVTVYSAGQLGTDQDKLKMVEDEAVQAAISTPNITASIIEENQALSIPFVFSDDMSVNQEVLASSEALNEDLAGIYQQRGVQVLSYWTEGFMAWTSNHRVDEPAGIEGFRVRTMPSPMLINTYEELGANPMPMDAGEIYTALQTNMIDGTENPLFFIHSGNTHEVQDYLTMGQHHIYVTSTMMNSDFLNRLPDQDQQVIEDVVEELDEWVFDLQAEMNEEALEEIAASDIEIIELTDQQRDRFRQMSMKARQDYIDSADQQGAQILETLIEEVEAAEAEAETDQSG